MYEDVQKIIDKLEQLPWIRRIKLKNCVLQDCAYQDVLYLYYDLYDKRCFINREESFAARCVLHAYLKANKVWDADDEIDEDWPGPYPERT